jgi:hypothetical protein
VKRKAKWKMPKWMEPYRNLIVNTGGTDIESGIVADGRITEFPTYAHAVHKADFLRIGMEGDVQSINVVKYPKRAK